MTTHRPNCPGHLPFTRRHFLFGAASLLPIVGKAEEIPGRAAMRNSARAVVFFNLNGGPSQMDTFDPKDGPWNPPGMGLTFPFMRLLPSARRT